MRDFLTAYKNTMGYEGKYVDDPDDKGGETYKGISRVKWPKWEGWKLIDMIKKHFAKEKWNQQMNANQGLQNLVQQFYLENYWLPLHLDAFDEPVAVEMFDTAVNQGRHASGTYLQQSLNKLNRNGKDYPDMVVDSKIGPTTRKAYKSYMATERFASRNTEKLLRWLIRWLNYYQLKKYDLITYKDPSQEKFIPGWTERT